jgi:hypothetical protein
VSAGRRALHRTIGAVAALCLASGAASAQPPAGASDREVVLFLYNQGKDLLEAGKVREACAAFEDARRLDPRAINLLMRLGDCYERLGRALPAQRAYQDAAAAAAALKDTRGAAAAERAQALEPRLSRLTLLLPPASDAPGLTVARDGEAVPRAQLGAAIPVDPGVLTIEARAPGKVGWTLRQEVGGDGARVVVTIPRLADEAPAAPRPRADEGSAGARRVLAVVAGAVGALGIGAGAAFGAKALARNRDANAGHCDAQSFCDEAGFALRTQARRAGDVSTALIAGGVAALGAGAVLFFTARRAPDAKRSARIVIEVLGSAAKGGGGLGLQGSF